MKNCSTPGCTDEVLARGMCTACYAFDRYHTTEKHGQWYWQKYVRKHARLLSRAQVRMVRRRKRA
jgi:hypothetical protein